MPQYGCFIHAASPRNLPVRYFILVQKILALVRSATTQEANYSKNENEGAQAMYVNDLGQVTHGLIEESTNIKDL